MKCVSHRSNITDVFVLSCQTEHSTQRASLSFFLPFRLSPFSHEGTRKRQNKIKSEIVKKRITTFLILFCF